MWKMDEVLLMVGRRNPAMRIPAEEWAEFLESLSLQECLYLYPLTYNERSKKDVKNMATKLAEAIDDPKMKKMALDRIESLWV